MKIVTQTPNAALNPAYRKEKVSRAAIERFKRELPLLLDRTANAAESEENHKLHFMSFLREVWYKDADCLVATKGRIDAVIHDGPKAKDPVGVMIEAKRGANKGEMFSPAKPNVKALHELVLYFVRERQAGNVAIKQLMITDMDAVYLFPDREFERLFWEKKRFRNQLLAADTDTGKTNATAYEIISRYIAELGDEEILHCTTFYLTPLRAWCEDGDLTTDKQLLPVYKALSPVHLLRRPFAGDSNHLDKGFYRELLHIIGLEEIGVDSKGREKKSGGKKIIRRATGSRRHPASLLENTLQVATKENRFRKVTDYNSYGADEEERQFAVVLELCLTWVNRVLFLKLLETQLVNYHGGGTNYRFLTDRRIPDFDGLNTLFFDVLNKPVAEREPIVSDFARVPYLNSSLFEISELEDQVLRVNSLKDQFKLPLAERSVLKGKDAPGELPPLHYLFQFLDAYDFGGEGKASIQEDNKKLINAGVLGLIFEKINGYRDGSFYTPGFITEYMCRETIRRAVVRKFRDDTATFGSFDSESYDDLKNYLARDNYKAEVRTAANALVNAITVCDPAVGSGHFLVSALNEIIATKSDLGVLGADSGAHELGIRAEIANDELILSDRKSGEPYEYRVTTLADGSYGIQPEVQAVQETIFREKRTLIENCLFGVDLNPNSVKICRLRLWIELLKHAFYRSDEGLKQNASLETLPNIDINIKQGNSLISRFALDDPLTGALADSGLTLADYRRAVTDYHRASGAEEKRRLLDLIDQIKSNFEGHISRNDKRVKNLAKARGQLTKLESLLEMGDLFGSVDEKKVRKEMAPLQTKVTQLEADVAAVRDNAIYQEAFEWRFEFPAVLGDDGEYLGFDVVVGNPPYVRQEELAAVKPYLKENYEVFAGTADLLVYFIELGMNNLTKGGQFSFIIANKFMRAGFGKALRRYIPQYRVRELIDFGDLPVFDEATTYPLIISLEKSEPTGEFIAANIPELHPTAFRQSLNAVSFTSLQTGLTEDGWNLADVKTQRLLEKIKQTGTPLGEYVNGEIYYGIKTGYNEAFVIDAATKDRLIAEDPQSAEIIKPFLAGRDVKRYLPPVADKYLILFPKGWTKALFGDLAESDAFAKLAEIYPAIATLLNPYEVAAKKRYDQGDYWWELRACDYYEEFEKPKIFYPDFGLRFNATISSHGEYGTNTLYFLVTDRLDILSLLNSELVQFYFKSVSSAFRGGYYRFFSQYVLQIPVKDLASISDQLTVLVTQILDFKVADPTYDSSALEAQIDLLVYQLYGLTYAEVLVVDPGFELGEAEYNEGLNA